MPHNLLLTGRSGIGKSSMLHQLVEEQSQLKIRGVVSDVVLENGVRVGWNMRAIGAAPVRLAHLSLEAEHRMGRYGVSLQNFERIALPEMGASEAELMVIDEIGIISSWSTRFMESMDRLLNSDQPVLAVVREKGEGYPCLVRARNDVEVLSIEEDNVETVYEKVRTWVHERVRLT